MHIATYREIQQKIENVYRRGTVLWPDGKQKKITGAVSIEEAMRLATVILEGKCTTTLETGVAFGVSTLTMLLALDAVNAPGAIHYGVDPEQRTYHEGAAFALQKEHGVRTHFELLEGPSHFQLPPLLERGVKIDFAFIDGWHTFDYTLLDFFYIDKLLKVGGIVAFHDCSWPSKRKVLGYLETHRKYELMPYPKAPVRYSAIKTLGSLRRGKFDVGHYAARKVELLMYRKLESWEPNHDFFADF